MDAAFDMLNAGPDVTIIVGFPNSAADGLRPSERPEERAYSPIYLRRASGRASAAARTPPQPTATPSAG